MKGKYIDTLILMACLSKQGSKKDIHEQVKETITERKKIMREWDNSFFAKARNEKDIHQQLQETIAEHKKIMAQWEEIFAAKQAKIITLSDKEAA